MSNMNKVQLIGYLGKDPEAKLTKAGKQFATMRMATSRKIGEEEKTQWHDVVVWNENSAQYVISYARKGTLVYVEGEIEYRQYEKDDGSIAYKTDIVVLQWNSNVLILGEGKPRDREGEPARPKTRPTRKEGYGQVTRQQKPEPQSVLPDDIDDELSDEIPF